MPTSLQRRDNTENSIIIPILVVVGIPALLAIVYYATKRKSVTRSKRHFFWEDRTGLVSIGMQNSTSIRDFLSPSWLSAGRRSFGMRSGHDFCPPSTANYNPGCGVDEYPHLQYNHTGHHNSARLLSEPLHRHRGFSNYLPRPLRLGERTGYDPDNDSDNGYGRSRWHRGRASGRRPYLGRRGHNGAFVPAELSRHSLLQYQSSISDSTEFEPRHGMRRGMGPSLSRRMGNGLDRAMNGHRFGRSPLNDGYHDRDSFASSEDSLSPMRYNARGLGTRRGSLRGRRMGGYESSYASSDDFGDDIYASGNPRANHRRRRRSRGGVLY